MIRTLLMQGKKKSEDVGYLGCLFVWKKLGCSERDLKRLQKVFTSADSNNSGDLDLLEFLMYVDVERTHLSRSVFKLFDYDDSNQMSFKEFAFAIWNFNSLDHPGLGRFTYSVYSKDGGVDAKGIEKFVEGVFGKEHGGPTSAKVEADLQLLRKQQGGKIDLHAWESFMSSAHSALGPLRGHARTGASMGLAPLSRRSDDACQHTRVHLEEPVEER